MVCVLVKPKNHKPKIRVAYGPRRERERERDMGRHVTKAIILIGRPPIATSIIEAQTLGTGVSQKVRLAFRSQFKMNSTLQARKVMRTPIIHYRPFTARNEARSMFHFQK
jgi:hypothetical protein